MKRFTALAALVIALFAAPPVAAEISFAQLKRSSAQLGIHITTNPNRIDTVINALQMRLTHHAMQVIRNCGPNLSVYYNVCNG